MNWLDIVIILIFAYNIVKGIIKGFFVTICNLFGVIIGFILAINYYEKFAFWLTLKANISSNYSIILTFPLIWLITFCFFVLIGKFLHTLSMLLLVSWLDHLMGGIIGALKGLSIIILILISLIKFNFSGKVQKEIKNCYLFALSYKKIPGFYKILFYHYPQLEKIK